MTDFGIFSQAAQLEARIMKLKRADVLRRVGTELGANAGDIEKVIAGEPFSATSSDLKTVEAIRAAVHGRQLRNLARDWETGSEVGQIELAALSELVGVISFPYPDPIEDEYLRTKKGLTRVAIGEMIASLGNT